MALHINLLPIGEVGLNLLSENTCGTEPANQLKPRLGQIVETTLIGCDGQADVPETTIDDTATVDVREQIFVIREPRAAMPLALLNRPTISELSRD
jgi:hypothetical protein